MTDIPKQKSGLAAFLFWNIIFHQPPEFLRYCIDEGFQNLQKEVKIWDSRLAAQRISENLPALLLWTILNIAMLCGWTLAGNPRSGKLRRSLSAVTGGYSAMTTIMKIIISTVFPCARKKKTAPHGSP